MNIAEQALASKIEFYKRDIDTPHAVNGFRGTWNIRDHHLIPGVFTDFLLRYFQVNRVSRIPLKKINALLNEVWEGPGSLEKVFRMEFELRATNDIKFPTKTKLVDEDETDETDEEELFFPDLSVDEDEED